MENTKPYKGWYENFSEILEEEPEAAEAWPDLIKLAAWEQERKEKMNYSPEEMAKMAKKYEEKQKKAEAHAEWLRNYEAESDEALRKQGFIPAAVIEPPKRPTPSAYKKQHPIDMVCDIDTSFDRNGTGREFLTDREGKYVFRYHLYMILHIYDRWRNGQEVVHYSFSEFEEQFNYTSFPHFISAMADPAKPDGFALFANLERIKKRFGDRYEFDTEFEKIEAYCIRPEKLESYMNKEGDYLNGHNFYVVNDSIENFRDAVISQYERFCHDDMQFDDCNRLYYTPEERAEITACHNA